MPNKKIYSVIGTMSGSSLDGLDIALCKITVDKKFSWSIEFAETIPFSQSFYAWMKSIPVSEEKNYTAENERFGNFTGEAILNFLQKHNSAKPQYIASHGHTVYHFPAKGKTMQISSGQVIADITGIPVLCDFRQADIDAGGQGAPLVPITDEYLFGDYHACLNIGGIANISFRENNVRTGFDICAANQLLNFCAAEMHESFDRDGASAKKGNIHPGLLRDLNSEEYYFASHPKSLDNSWIRNTIFPLLERKDISPEDKLATVNEHIAFQIARVMTTHAEKEKIAVQQYKLLVTGGGAHNIFLIRSIEQKTGIKIHLSSRLLIDYKEALAMCMMGVLYLEELPNFIPSVTGAKKAVRGGKYFTPAMQELKSRH